MQTLERWGIYKDEINPVARTNICPEFDKLAVPSIYAFSYTVPARSERGSFIIAGGGDAIEGKQSIKESIVRYSESSREAMREKVRFVVSAMEERLKALGFGWHDAISTHAYTVRDIGSLVGDEIGRRGVAPGGLAWHFCRPAIVGLEYEMDVRGAAREIMV